MTALGLRVRLFGSAPSWAGACSGPSSDDDAARMYCEKASLGFCSSSWGVALSDRARFHLRALRGASASMNVRGSSKPAVVSTLVLGYAGNDSDSYASRCFCRREAAPPRREPAGSSVIVAVRSDVSMLRMRCWALCSSAHDPP